MVTKQRLHYVDVSNCVAILFVLIMHSAQLTHFGSGQSPQFLLTAIVQLVCIPAVYIFHIGVGSWQEYYQKVLTNPIHIYALPLVAYAVLVPLVLLCKRSRLIRRVLP